jgi:hypothetical protein
MGIDAPQSKVGRLAHIPVVRCFFRRVRALREVEQHVTAAARVALVWRAPITPVLGEEGE